MSAGAARSAARLAAVQALYQMDVTGKTLPDIFAEFESFWIGGEIEGERYNPAELAFFRDIVKGVLADQRVLDNAVNDALVSSWPLARIDSVMRAILRAGAYELKNGVVQGHFEELPQGHGTQTYERTWISLPPIGPRGHCGPVHGGHARSGASGREMYPLSEFGMAITEQNLISGDGSLAPLSGLRGTLWGVP